MNSYLIGFLVGLSVYSAIWVGLKAWFYADDLHTHEAMWYTVPEAEWSVSKTIVSMLSAVH